MLKIWLGAFQKDCIIDPSGYFNRHKKPDWFNRQDIKDIIMEIDHVMAVQDEFMISPIIGGMSPASLSSGCKCLILLYLNPTCNVYASRCGDNCSDRILDLAEKTDVVITLHHPMIFNRDFDGMIMETGRKFSTKSEYADAYVEYVYRED